MESRPGQENVSAAKPVAATSSSVEPPPSPQKMVFSDLYKSPRSPLSKLRYHQQPLHLSQRQPDYDADLLSKDKAKQKEAVRRYLAERIRNDWDFVWPPLVSTSSEEAVLAVRDDKPQSEPEGVIREADKVGGDVTRVEAKDGSGNESDREEDALSVYSTVSEDSQHFRPRMEWSSDFSDDDDMTVPSSPFRFDTPDAVGTAVKASAMAKKDQRRRAIREEMQWNNGLACFEARRTAWTGARTVRVRSKPQSPVAPFSPLSPRRFFFRASLPPTPTTFTTPASPISPTHRRSVDASAALSDSSEPSKDGADLAKKTSKPRTSSSSAERYPVETLIPIPPPLLPPENPMRACITPSVHISLYDKIIVNALTPSCPVNLSDMIRACVAGWKRDGEWPPKTTDPGRPVARRKKRNESGSIGRRMSFGFLTRGEKGDDAGDDANGGKGIRRSLQRVLGIGHGHGNGKVASEQQA